MRGGSPSARAPGRRSAPSCRRRCPSAEGWRGGHLRGVEAIEALDELVHQIADDRWARRRHLAGRGVRLRDRGRRRAEPVPFLLDVDLRTRPPSAAEAIARCAIGSSVTGWRQRTAQALSAWSVHAPRAVDPLEMDAALQLTDGETRVETWCRLLGMAVPVDREPDAADVAAQARAALDPRCGASTSSAARSTSAGSA